MSASPPRVHLSIVHPFDPWAQGIGGYDTFLDGFLRSAPPAWRLEVIGVTGDRTRRPPGRRTVGELHGRPVELLPVLGERDADRVRALPLSLRFAAAARARRIRPRGAIVQFHRFESLFAVPRAAPRRSVCFLHNHPPELVSAASDVRWRGRGRLLDAGLALALARVDAVGCVDPRSSAWIEARFPRLVGRVFEQPVWADPTVFRPGSPEERRRDRAALRRRLDLDPETRIAVLAGRLESQKDPLLLVDACAQIAEVEPRLTLLFVGRGRLEAAIDRRAAEAGLGSRVRRLPSLPRPELAAVYRGAELSVCCSAFESGPRSVLESLACGCPTVSFDVGQAGDALTPLADLGLLVGERGTEPLAAAILRTLALGDLEEIAARCAAAVADATPAHAVAPLFRRYSGWLEADDGVPRRAG